MIRHTRKLRRRRFTSPVLLGAADYVIGEAAYNPFRPGSPHYVLYLIGFTYARDRRSNAPSLKMHELRDFADKALRALGYQIDPPGTLHDA